MSGEHWPPLSPLQTGLRGRCPRCGKGHLFQGFLKLRPSCEVCGLDYSFADPADGPAFFVMMFVCVPAAAFPLWLELNYNPPTWVHLVTTLPLILLTCIPSFGIYPIIVHGKPYDWRTLPAFFPIMFELTILFSAFTTVFALMIFSQLPKWYHPVFNWERFKKVTDDGFFLVIESRDPKFSESKTREVLEGMGGQHVTLIHD